MELDAWIDELTAKMADAMIEMAAEDDDELCKIADAMDESVELDNETFRKMYYDGMDPESAAYRSLAIMKKTL